MWRSLPIPVFLLLLNGCSGEGAPAAAQEDVPADPRQEWSQRMIEIDKRLAASPGSAKLWAERARHFQAADSSRQAINDWKRAVQLDSTDVDHRIELGEYYYTKLLVDLAREQLERAIELDPRQVRARLKLAEIELVLRHYKPAMELVNAALRLENDNARAYYLKGWIHKEAGDTALAISSLRTAVEQDPEYYDAFIQLGLLHAARRDPLAAQYYATAIDLRPQSVEAWYNKGMYHQERGQDSLAMSCYDRITEIDPGNALAPYNRGYILLESRGEARAAVKEFTQALDLETNYYQAWYSRGLALERLGVLDSAAADYQVALLIRPDYDPAAFGLSRVHERGAYVKGYDKRERK